MRIKSSVTKDAYSNFAQEEIGCSCLISQSIYSEDVKSLPSQLPRLSSGCGDPLSFVNLSGKEVLLDLGSGVGVDALLAARRFGKDIRIVGVDFSEKAVEKARENAKKLQIKNVEFRVGKIEDLPVEEESIDVAISNCVINLSSYKERVLREVFRVLKPGGRIILSEIVTDKKLPRRFKTDLILWVLCLGGAIPEESYRKIMQRIGFVNVTALAMKKIISYKFHSNINFFVATINGYKP